MIVLGILLGASVAFVAFCIGYGVGYNAPHPAEPPTSDTRTTTNVVSLEPVRFNAAAFVFPHDTSRGLLQ